MAKEVKNVPEEHRSLKRFDAIFSLRFILNVPFVLILVISSGLIGFLGFQNGVDSAYDLSRQLLTESGLRVQKNLDSFFSVPQDINNQNRVAIRLNRLDLHNPLALQQHFLSQVQSYSNIKGITYASEEGEFFGSFRDYFGADFVYATATEATEFTLFAYEVNEAGEAGEVLYTRLNNNPRSRVWYQVAVSTGHSTWSPIYTRIDNLGISIDAVSPVYAANGDLLGVLDVSLDLSGISEFLISSYPNSDNQVFIIDDTGLLVAASTLSQPYAMVNDTLQRDDTRHSTEPLIQNAMQELMREFGDWSSIEGSHQFSFDINGERQLAQVIPYQLGETRWWIVVSKPESSFMASIYQHIQLTIALISGLLFFSVASMAIVARWISHPIIQLNQVTKSFTSGNWSERLHIHRGDEIGQLASSFNQMADELQASVAELQSSEARLRAIFENSSEAILMSQNGLHVKANPAYFKMFGYKSADDLLHKPILDIIAPRERERIAEYIRLRSMGAFAPLHYETIGIKKNGTEFDVEIHVSTFYQNAERYSLGIFQDISERKQAQTALTQQTYELTERLKELNCLYEHSKILERADISIEELCRATVNLIPPAWQYPEITSASILLEGQQYSTSKFRNTDWQQSSPITVDNEVIGSLTVSYLEQRPMDYEGPFLAEERLLIDELARRLGHKIKALRADASLRQYYETLEKKVVERTSELTLVRDALREALATEKELGELKTRFVSMASHEFRTPLATILALSESLDAYRHKMEETEIEECLNNIKLQVSHLKGIVEDVLLLTKMQAKRQEFNPVKQNLLPVLRSVIYEFQNRSDIQHQLSFTSNQDKFEAFLDPKLIRQVVSNLLSNAIKYSPTDKPIEIKLECSSEDIFLTIKDYGIGIPENELKHLFEPFHRASNVGIISGTGLGLVITKESIELHGGTITVESHINVGTTFVVHIPLPIAKDSYNEQNTGD